MHLFWNKNIAEVKGEYLILKYCKILSYAISVKMPEAAPKGRGRPKGMKNGEGKPVKPERPATHIMKTRGK